MNQIHTLTPETEARPEDLIRNLNEKVQVKVTDYGEQVWDDNYRVIFGDQYDKYAADYKLERDAEGFTTMQLHEAMRVFGPAMPDLGGKLPIHHSIRFPAEGAKREITRSIYDRIAVNVTATGESAWREAYPARNGSAHEAHVIALPRDAEGATVLTLDEAMRVFGPVMPVGMGTPFNTEFSFTQ